MSRPRIGNLTELARRSLTALALVALMSSSAFAVATSSQSPATGLPTVIPSFEPSSADLSGRELKKERRAYKKAAKACRKAASAKKEGKRARYTARCTAYFGTGTSDAGEQTGGGAGPDTGTSAPEETPASPPSSQGGSPGAPAGQGPPSNQGVPGGDDLDEEILDALVGEDAIPTEVFAGGGGPLGDSESDGNPLLPTAPIESVPEPGSAALLGLGLLALGLQARRRRRRG